MTSDKHHDPVDTGAADTDRRNLALALLGALSSGALLEACNPGDGAEPDTETLAKAAEAATGTAISWADTVLGAVPPGARTGDLAKKNSSAIGNAILVVAKGCVVAGDGGGGAFYWEAGVMTGDDGGTIIVPQPSPTGRWRRIFDGPLNVRWFGARGNGSTSPTDTTAISNALLAAAGGATVYFPPGTYRVNTNIAAPHSNTKLIGAGVGATVIWDTRAYNVSNALPNKGLFSFIGVSAPEVARMTLDGNWTHDANGLPRNVNDVTRKAVYASGCPDAYFHDLEARNFVSESLAVDADCPRTRIEQNHVHDCSFPGLNISSTSPASASSYIRDNVVIDCFYSAIQVSAYSCTISGNTIKRCGLYGGDVLLTDGVEVLNITDNIITECNLLAGPGAGLISIFNFHAEVTNAKIVNNLIGKNVTASHGGNLGAPIYLHFPNGGGTLDCNIVIAGNHIFECGQPASDGNFARAIAVDGAPTGRILIAANTFRRGATNMRTGIKLTPGLPDPNGIEVGHNCFAADIPQPVDYGVRPSRATYRDSRPSSAGLQAGYSYFETPPGINKPVWWDGAAWRDANGTVV